MILLSYKYDNINFFGDSYENIYILTVQKSYFFGLIKREFKIKQSISMFSSISKHEDLWNRMIAEKTRFN